MAEKESANTTTYSQLTRLAKLSIRLAEICAALALLAWISARIPLAVEISGDYLRQASGIFSNHLFVFFLCHVILVSLMANSGQFSRRANETTATAAGRGGNAEAELYEAMVKKTESESENDVASREAEEIVCEDKEVISEVNSTAINGGEAQESSAESSPDPDFPVVLYRRWRSENYERDSSSSDYYPSENLRRSGSEKCLDIVVPGKEERNPTTGDSFPPHEKLSDEDFNRTVEAFIAKQINFRRQEDVYDAVSMSCGDNKSYELTKAKLCY